MMPGGLNLSGEVQVQKRLGQLTPLPFLLAPQLRCPRHKSPGCRMHGYLPAQGGGGEDQSLTARFADCYQQMVPAIFTSLPALTY